MKNRTFILVIGVVVSLLSCGGGAEEKEKVDERVYQHSVNAPSGEYSMQPSSAQGIISMNDVNYKYEVNRTPSPQLPKVKDEQGNSYVDNVIELKVFRKDKQILSKRFTKKDFASQVNATFLAGSILEGLVFDREVNGRLRFAASVCYPQTDLFMPLCILVASDGSYRIEKGSVLEESVPSGNVE